MFENIGGKIKGLAVVIFIILTIAAVIAAFFLIGTGNDGSVLFGILLLIIGPLTALITSWFLYGFGQLIENSDILVSQSKKQLTGISKLSTNSNQKDISEEKIAESIKSSKQSAPSTTTDVKRCPLCGEKVTSKTCGFCGTENNLF